MQCTMTQSMVQRPVASATRGPQMKQMAGHTVPCRQMSRQQRMPACRPVAALQIDWSDPDTLIAVAGAFAGLAVGVGIPAFFISRQDLDAQRLEELRQLNRETFKATGSYMTEEEIAAFRKPRWTDRREFADDD